MTFDKLVRTADGALGVTEEFVIEELAPLPMALLQADIELNPEGCC